MTVELVPKLPRLSVAWRRRCRRRPSEAGGAECSDQFVVPVAATKVWPEALK